MGRIPHTPFMSSFNYPWTNLDNKNLDWFINAMQKLYTDWKEYAKDFDAMKDWLIDYLREYDNHIKEEILVQFLESEAFRNKVIEIIEHH